MEKVFRIGTIPNGKRTMSVFVEYEYKQGRLSLSGVEGPTRTGNCSGGAGQIVMSWDDDYLASIRFAPGWDMAKVRKLRDYWQTWHLNDMKAGSPAQTAFLETPAAKSELEAVRYPDSHYDRAKALLAAAGLDPDPNYLHEGAPYSYGHAWLRVEVPTEVIAWLNTRPTTDTPYAWAKGELSYR